MNHFKFSIIIVTRNRATDLLRCLQSVFAQDYIDLEVIVVDNASTDNTTTLIAQTYPSVTILRQSTNTGAPEGRNIGIKHAHGELMLCLDDDAELLDPQTINKSVRYFREDTRLACLSFLVLDQHGKIVRKLIPRRDRKHITDDTPGAMFSATGCILRRSAFLEVGGFWEKLNPYFGEEPELSYRLQDNGYRILLTPHIAVRHYESPMERPSDRRLYCGVRNTPWLALRNLPWYCVISLTVLAWGYFSVVAIRNHQLTIFFKAISDSIVQWPAIYRIRKPIYRETQKLIWKYSGVLFF